VTPGARWMVRDIQANFALARETKPQKSVHPDEGMKRGDRSASIHISFLHCSSLLINSNDTYTAVRFRLPPPFSDGVFPHPIHACTHKKQLFALLTKVSKEHTDGIVHVILLRLEKHFIDNL
jgi:hypothetical protein